MILCYTYGWVPYSVIIREVSSSSTSKARHYPKEYKWDVSIKSLPKSSENATEEEAERIYKELHGKWRTAGENGPLNQPSKAHMNSKRLSQEAQGLWRSAAGPLCIYYRYQFTIFTIVLSRWICGSLILVSCLVTLFLLFGCLSSLDVTVFALSYYSLFCQILVEIT